MPLLPRFPRRALLPVAGAAAIGGAAALSSVAGSAQAGMPLPPGTDPAMAAGAIGTDLGGAAVSAMLNPGQFGGGFPGGAPDLDKIKGLLT